MRFVLFLALVLFPVSTLAQSTDTDGALLAKTRALYDTPFLRGLISFDCRVRFDFEKHLRESFGSVPPNASALVTTLNNISYRVFVDHSGATVSIEGKAPDLSTVPQATALEQTNRQLIQAGIGQWVAFAYGEILPVGPTKAHFNKTPDGYTITMNGPGIAGTLRVDPELSLLGGTIETSQHIEFVSKFAAGPNGLLLDENTVDVDHSGPADFRFTYRQLDSYQLPDTIALKSAQGLRWEFALTDCKTQHGIVVKVKVLPPDQH